LLHKSGVYFLWAYPFSVYWWNLFYYSQQRTLDYGFYAAGFLAATGGLHLGGIGLGLGVMRLGPVAARALGLGVTATGLGLLAGAG